MLHVLVFWCAMLDARHALVFALILCAGCSFVPKEVNRNQTVNDTAKVQAAQNADLHQHITGPAPAPIKTETNPKTGVTTTEITPAPQSVDTRYRASGSVNADTDFESMWAWTETIPMGVKLILLAI